jgi:hypothetical protein
MIFGPNFIHWFITLHQDSKAFLLVQGCPWAPLLFTCAVEPLACLICSSTVPGIPLSTHYSLKYKGYADDTTIHFDDLKDLPLLTTLLTSFFHYSGLKINTHKSIVIPLGNAVTDSPPSTSPYKWLDNNSHERFLGVNILLDPQEDHTTGSLFFKSYLKI